MAGKKISELPTGTQVSGPELFPAVQSATTKKFTLSSVLAWVKSQISASSIGAQPTITASGILKGNGAGGVSAATPGTDYGTYSKPSGGIPASDLASGVIPSVPLAYTSNPAMDSTASPGSSGAWARGDHVHPSDTSKANQAQLAYVESGTTASRAYAVGEYFCWNGLLYWAKTAISSGGTFTPGTNCEQVTDGGLNDLNSVTLYDIPFNSGYSVVTGGSAKYGKTKNGIVTVSANIRHGSTDISPFEPFTLPDGFRPKNIVTFLARNGNHGYLVMGSIGTDGIATFYSLANKFGSGATFNTGLAFRDVYFDVTFLA